MLLSLLKQNKIKGEIPKITNLATAAALTAVENKILNVSNLVKKTTTKKQNWNTTQKLVKLKMKLLMIMIMINILLLKKLTR